MVCVAPGVVSIKYCGAHAMNPSVRTGVVRVEWFECNSVLLGVTNGGSSGGSDGPLGGHG